MKYFLKLLAFNLIISTIHTIISGFSTYSFINCSFIIGMIYLLFGLICFVFEKGFFNITIFAFNKVRKQYKKKRGLLCEDTNITIDGYINKQNKFFLTNNLLYCGLFIAIVSIGISFIAIS